LATTVENELFVASYLSQRFNFIRIDHVEKIDLDLVTLVIFITLKNFF
jgi:hypothetical protein